VSTRWSFVDVDPLGEDNYINIHNLCELYIDVDPLILVPIGNVYNLGLTIQHKKIKDDSVSIVMEEVKDSNAQVPFPTDEVQTMGHAPNHFIQWPRKLVKSISTKVSVINFFVGCNDIITFINIVLPWLFRLWSNVAKIFNTKSWNLNLIHLNIY